MHQASPFPLILLDWVLPGMDGVELCRRVRQLPGGDSPVILLSTVRDKLDFLLAGLDAGVDDYLTKPLNETTLLTRLAIAERTALERARRELTEEALLSSEQSFRTLIEGSPDGILTHRSGRVVYVNPSLLAALRYTTYTELVGQPFLHIVHPDDTEQATERIEAMLRSGQPAPAYEVRLLAKDGQVVTMEEIAIPLEFEGHPAVASVFRNVGDRKRMEQQLLLADRMVSVGTLAAGIAHEINNPLTFVLSNLKFVHDEVSEMAKSSADERLEAVQDLLTQADEGAERVRVIVRDLKTFSRADERGVVTADLHRVLDSAIGLAWNEIRHRAQLHKEYEAVPPVSGNEAKLGQVFLNLLVNSAQALPVGQAGHHAITVRTHHAATQDRVVVDVEDTGIGIPPDIQHRIFDPFFTTKPVGHGVGLGLSICHNIISSCGGTIAVSALPHRGSRFRVTLPVALDLTAHPSIPGPAPAAATAYGTQVRILIVDDEPSVARALQRALRDHDVTVALSGREALAILRDREVTHFDVIFCDLMMAEVSGTDLYEEVVLYRPSLAKRFVFMTGGAFTDRARAFIHRVDNPLLEKPFDIRQVQALVRDLAQRRSPHTIGAA